MSLYAIHQYHAEVEKLIHYGGTKKETSIRNAFSRLLDYYAHSRDLKLVPEISIKTKEGRTIRPDGILKDILRLDHGYWESKDGNDDINEEIRKKRNKGYPFENILFEDSTIAILFQNNIEVLRVPMSNGPELDELLNRFVRFERKEVRQFHKAIEHFKEDIPKVTLAIRQVLEDQKDNLDFKKALESFFLVCKQAINSSITMSDIQEMLVQHILSADIFNTIFDEPHFHQENNIARELNKVIQSFFFGSARRSALNSIKHYYDTINATAATIADHHEKQKFLKVVYENFYKAYNPKAADRLGIVYTPNEIVKFMIESSDFLLHKHFGKALADKNVEILDPATGTGTFMCDIIDYLRLHGSNKLKYKYKNELHANEVAILPYYIANLNIEYTFKQATGEYEEFKNLCFVDTLDNTGFAWQGKQTELFSLSAENVARIKNQNSKKISVIIGNPPYNANQQSENENNKNRAYPVIDKRIKDTFIKHSTAQKTKMYDMYSRFFRWAMDRLNENGVISFVANRSFIESRTFDGFRKCIQTDFDFAYIIDTKSDVRANPKIAGTTHNVFGIQTGVAVIFLVRVTGERDNRHHCEIQYVSMEDEWRKERKLQWFSENKIDKIEFEKITPDKNNNWINISENSWDDFNSIKQLFHLVSPGVNTARDEWVFDVSKENLCKKAKFLTEFYNNHRKKKGESFPVQIKWSPDLKKHFRKDKEITFSSDLIRQYFYRPFIKVSYYAEKLLSDRLTSKHYQMFGELLTSANKLIAISGPASTKPFSCLGVKGLSSFDFLEKTQCIPLYLYNSIGEKIDNVSDYALNQFQNKYKKDIVKDDIFYYVYAVLHHPEYRKKYERNLKQELPRIPFYIDFSKWVQWGQQLMDLHLNYESTTAYGACQEKEIAVQDDPKTKLKALKEKRVIQLDENTELSGIPEKAWEYKLGNRSAIEWILDQYKENKPKDSTIAKHFDNYRFQDYKKEVIELLKKICTISLQTMEIVSKMK